MRRFKLRNADARRCVAQVWKHLRQHHPEDARLLRALVRRIEAVPEDDPLRADTVGEWRAGRETILLADSEDLDIGTVAHEMGHAVTRDEELIARQSPRSEWACEASADMHAVRWGLLTLEDIRRRFEDNVAAARGKGVPEDAAWAHHGPPPGGQPFEICGTWWRLREDFVFEEMKTEPG